MATDPLAPRPLKLSAADGYPLAATLYPASKPIGQILVGSATGVPQGFYRRFAEYAASHGYTTLTLDYRGIGASAPASLKGFEMDYLDWADKDLAAGVDYLSQSDLPLYLVGHSFGGHAFGLLPNRDAITAVHTFGTGAGWHGWMPKGERRKVQFMWNLVLPVIVAIKGYQAWNWLGMGEDLPKGVYRDWKHWCRYPRYFFEDPKMAWLTDHFAAVRTPIKAAVSLDDLWAGPASRDAFMSAFTGADYQAQDIDPKALGLKPLGHMGYFRAYAEPLWRDALEWFAHYPAVAQAAPRHKETA